MPKFNALTNCQPPASKQRGTILFISLIILLLLTILGVTSMSNVTMEERMAGNLRDGDLAFQSAEAGLRDAEAWLLLQGVEPTKCAAIGVCNTAYSEGVVPGLAYQADIWWQANGRDYRAGGILTGANAGTGSYVSAPPDFIIEFQNFVPDSLVVGHSTSLQGRQYYLVSSYAVGGSNNAESVLQTSYARRHR